MVPRMTSSEPDISEDRPLLRVKHLTKHFPVHASWYKRSKSLVHAVDGITFDIGRGESLGLAGESGCGKTTVGKLLVRLAEPTGGRIIFEDGVGQPVDVATLAGRGLKAFRKNAQMIFQDPYESINPRRTVYDTIVEPLQVQKIGSPLERMDRVSQMLDMVGLNPSRAFLFRFPHELSGGQRQRVAIARALVVEPAFVVADEPTSMLDASIKTGVMRLMADLADRLQISYLYITHDLAVARYACTRIAVMYLGKLVEVGETEDLLRRPQHPYTRALVSAAPVPDPSITRPPVDIVGAVSTAVDPPARCRFYDRCPLADDFCRDNDQPALVDKGAGRLVACYKA